MTDAPQDSSRWYHSVGFVLLMLFLLAGPLALPLLWKSPRFALWAKWLLTVLMCVSLIWLIAKGADIIRTTLEQYNSLSL